MNRLVKHLLSLALASILALFTVAPLLADDDDPDFVIRVRPGTIAAVVARYRLEVEGRVAGQEIYLVEYEGPGLVDAMGSDDDDDDNDDDDDDDDDSPSTPPTGGSGGSDDDDDDNSTPAPGSGSGGSGGTGSGGGTGGGSAPGGFPSSLTVKQFIALVLADPDVLSFELNEDVDLPEDDDRSIPAPVSDAPFSPLLPDRTLNNYYGDTAWTGYVGQPANAILGLGRAHSASYTGGGVVAVIDTGVDPQHPALRNALVAGFDFFLNQSGTATEMTDIDPNTNGLLQQSTVAFLDGNPITLDKRVSVVVRQSTVAFLDGSKIPSSFGHGTMVAGVIRLAAPTARIMPLRAFRADGSSDLFHIISAVYYAADRGVKVINMSFSLPTESPELTRAIQYATMRNVICVASVGNQGSSALVYPAALTNVIGVASVSNSDTRSSFSNFGPGLVTIAAPGEGVLTTYPGGTYAAAWGTSYSAPFVAAAVALLAQDQPALTHTQAEAALRKAVPLTPDLGAGRLDVAAALGMLPAPATPSSGGGTGSGSQTSTEVTPASAASKAIYRCGSGRRGAGRSSNCVLRSTP